MNSTDPQDDDLFAEEEESPAPQEFHITDQQTLNWAVRKLNAMQAYRLRVKQWAQKELERLEKREAAFLARFEVEMQQVVLDQLENDPLNQRKKSLVLPAGVIGFRTTPVRIEVANEALALEWARKHLPEAVVSTTSEKLSRQALREHALQTGEEPPGCRLISPEEKLYVK